MMKCHCGADWFIEEKLVRPAGEPRSVQHTPLPNADMPFIRYRCSECGSVYGEKPQPKTEPAKKKPGRPKKSTSQE